MATKRVTHTFRKGDIMEVKEYHDGRYGARGLPREKKRKPTPEQMAVVNAMNKAETARHRLLEYFGKGDYFLTLTYRVEARPPDMAKAKKDFTNLISKLRTRYKNRSNCAGSGTLRKGPREHGTFTWSSPDAGIRSAG